MIPSRAPFGETSLVLHPPMSGPDGEVELTSFAPGPAGTARTDSHRDVSLEVDFAEPDRLCSIVTVDLAGSRSLETLLGGAGYRAVRYALLEGGDRSKRVGLGLDASQIGTGRPNMRSGAADDARAFGVALAARAVGDDPFEPDLVRAIAYVEAAAQLRRSLWADTVDAAGLEEQLMFAADLLVDDVRGEQVLAGLSLPVYERLREAIVVVTADPAWSKRRWALRLRSVFAQRLFDLDERRRGRDAAKAARSVAYTPLTSARESRIVEALRSAPAADRSVPPPAEATWEYLGPGRYAYRCSQRPDGSWLRVLDAQTQSLLALAPIARTGRRWEALVVLPITVAPPAVIHVVTDTPIVGSASSVDTMLDAIDHGRAAAVLSAGGDPAAVTRWQLCARLWSELGDTTRANRALAYATGREQVTRPAFVHDTVREELQ